MCASANRVVEDHPLGALNRIMEANQTVPRLNTGEEIGKGNINTTHRREYTILLIGETGTGKTSLLSLIANVLEGRSPSEYVVHHTEENEAGGPQNQSQTKSAKLYELTSKNGIKIRIIDTPGLADTRGLARDKSHKGDIAGIIEKEVVALDAVIILANGTVRRLDAATDYVLSTLSSIFPHTLVNNIGILFTHVMNRARLNFDQASLPDDLRKIKNNRFLLDNPFALWQNIVQICDQEMPDPEELVEMQDTMNQSHEKATEALAHLFDWLDTRIPQPTKDMVDLYHQSRDIELNIENVLARAKQLGEKKAKLAEIKQSADDRELTKEDYENYINVSSKREWIQVRSEQTLNLICHHPGCYSNCYVLFKSIMPCFPVDVLIFLPVLEILQFPLAPCEICGHSFTDHSYSPSHWEMQGDVDKDIEADGVDMKRVEKSWHQTLVELNEHITRLDREMKEALVSIGRLTKSYATLCLVGSFAGQIRKSIRLLELNLEAMRDNKEADAHSIQMVELSLDDMKRKLEVVKEAGENE
ncbi:hypothetical protein APHAL10511_000442 [Amanita phalloides]|nr:hypothetical protein APHAL10511_000442 [Amanita phalloides]